MRDALFKAKEISTDKWVEGYLVKISEDDYRIATKEDINWSYTKLGDYDGVMTRVDHNTICQYTGLTDKNGNKIWENDVVKYEDVEVDFEGYHYNVFVNVGKTCITPQGVFFTNRQTVYMDDLWLSECSLDAEVIGNIFDNPELLKNE